MVQWIILGSVPSQWNTPMLHSECFVQNCAFGLRNGKNVDVTGNLQHNIFLMIDFTCQKAEDSALNLLKTHYLLENTLPASLLPSTVDAYISSLFLKYVTTQHQQVHFVRF